MPAAGMVAIGTAAAMGMAAMGGVTSSEGKLPFLRLPDRQHIEGDIS
jgi:hypothetical protein